MGMKGWRRAPPPRPAESPRADGSSGLPRGAGSVRATYGVPHGDGSWAGRLLMYAPNYRSAQALQTRIESSILGSTCKQLKRELAGGNRTVWTVRSFYERFLEEYCQPRPRCLRRYALSFKSLNAVPGNIPLPEVGVLAGWAAGTRVGGHVKGIIEASSILQFVPMRSSVSTTRSVLSIPTP